MARYLAQGVREDCMALLNKFADMNSMRFQDFAQCWREMLFSHIVTGRANYHEQVEFLQVVMALVKNIFVTTPDLFQKVGAIYLLYGLFEKMPPFFRHMVFIRVTKEDWDEFLAVKQEIIAGSHHDAHYALTYLFQQGAFLFVATDFEMAPDLRYRDLLGGEKEKQQQKQEAAETSQLTDYLARGLDQLTTLHNKYKSIKKQLFKDTAGRSLSVLGEDVAPKIIKMLTLASQGKSFIRVPETDEPASTSSVGAERQSVRQKALRLYEGCGERGRGGGSGAEEPDPAAAAEGSPERRPPGRRRARREAQLAQLPAPSAGDSDPESDSELQRACEQLRQRQRQLQRQQQQLAEPGSDSDSDSGSDQNIYLDSSDSSGSESGSEPEVKRRRTSSGRSGTDSEGASGKSPQRPAGRGKASQTRAPNGTGKAPKRGRGGRPRGRPKTK